MATKKTFDFKLGDKVKIERSDEHGEVVGRAHYRDSNPNFLVAYVAADGRACEAWFQESELAAA